PHRHEAAGAERDLTAVTGEDVEPDRGDRIDQEGHEDGIRPVVVDQERHDPEGHGDHGVIAQAVEPDGESLCIVDIARLEVAGLAVEHVSALHFPVRPGVPPADFESIPATKMRRRGHASPSGVRWCSRATWLERLAYPVASEWRTSQSQATMPTAPPRAARTSAMVTWGPSAGTPVSAM